MQIVPVVPFSLTNRAGVAPPDVQRWTAILLAIYGGTLVAFSPVAGWAADYMGARRMPLLISLLALLASGMMLCFGRSVTVFIVGRLLLGISGAVVWSVGMALVVDSVPKEEVGKCLGYVFMSISMVCLSAPLIGGVVYAAAGYYAVFYISFGLIALDILLRIALIEKKDARKWINEDEVAQPPPQTEAILATGTDSAKSPAESTIIEAQQSESKEGNYAAVFSLMKTPRVITAFFGCCVQATLFSTFDTVLPLHVHDLFGWNSLGAGLIFLAFLIPSFASPVVGWANDKLGPKWIACIGFLLCFPALVLLREVTHDGIRQIVLLCALLAIIGFGVNFIGIPFAAEISYAIEANEEKRPGRYGAKGAYAQGYALLNSGFATGTLIGPIWSGYVVTQSGWGTLGWSLGLLCVVAIIPTVIWTGGKFSFIRRQAETSILNGVSDIERNEPPRDEIVIEKVSAFLLLYYTG